jgi:CheY-like chemotaxis protein
MASDRSTILLYVEDEAIVSMVVTLSLEDAGYVVRHVSDGSLAIAALEESDGLYRALVTDIRVPEVSGWEIARRARELNPDMPVVYVTGDSVAQWSAEGVAGSIILEKPFEYSQLAGAITTLLRASLHRAPGDE